MIPNLVPNRPNNGTEQWKLFGGKQVSFAHLARFVISHAEDGYVIWLHIYQPENREKIGYALMQMWEKYYREMGEMASEKANPTKNYVDWCQTNGYNPYEYH